jgi:DNA-binding NtrC family response regulator
VRELRSVLERACLLTDGHLLNERQLALAWSTGSAPAPALPRGDEGAATPEAPPEPDQRLETIERAQIERVLRETGGNKALAARQLGMSRRALYRRLERFKRG